MSEKRVLTFARQIGGRAPAPPAPGRGRVALGLLLPRRRGAARPRRRRGAAPAAGRPLRSEVNNFEK